MNEFRIFNIVGDTDTIKELLRNDRFNVWVVERFCTKELTLKEMSNINIEVYDNDIDDFTEWCYDNNVAFKLV